MSLFVGNISRDVRSEDLHDEFDVYGKCVVNFKVRKSFNNSQGSFAFVEFDNERDAEDALNNLNNKEIRG